MCSWIVALFGASPAGSIDLYAEVELASLPSLFNFMFFGAISCGPEPLPIQGPQADTENPSLVPQVDLCSQGRFAAFLDFANAADR